MKREWKIILLTLFIGWFIGAASGLLLMRTFRPMGMGRRGGMREFYSRNLKLSPEQKAKVDAILQTHRQKLDAFFSQTRPQIEAIRNETRTKIREILNPDQQAAFDKIDARMQERFKRRLERH